MIKGFGELLKVADDGSPASASTVTATCVSPGKRVNLRGQCVHQLLQLHDLLEKGAINKEQCDDMQSAILNDVK